jgi:uncharacterized membrane protein
MPTVQSLQKEVDALKAENKKILKLIRGLKTEQEPLSQPEDDSSEDKSDSEESSSNTGGIILIILGGLLCLTFIGAVIGVPLIIWGIVVVSKNSSKGTDKKKADVKTTSRKTVARKRKLSRASLEEDVGMKWFARIGILALIIGVGFFIKYAIDNGWISHLTRIILGVVFGVALVVFGDIVSKKKRYAHWGKTLVGGGLAITYFVVYAAYHFIEYREAIGMPQSLNILLMMLVVLSAVVLSLKDNSQIIAGEAFLLGYITSLLSNNFELLTLVYGLLLTLGLVFVVCYKRWTVLGFGGLVVSYGLYVLLDPSSFAYAAVILVTYFVAFTVQSLFLNKQFHGQAVTMTVANSMVFFLLFYIQMQEYYPHLAGLFTLLVALVHLMLYYVKQSQEKKLGASYLYLGLLYLTLTVPIELNNELITIVWAIETLVLVLLYVKLEMPAFKHAAYGVGFITLFKNVLIDSTTLHALDFAHFLSSTRFFSFLATAVAFFVVYRVLSQYHKLLPPSEQLVPIICSWISSGVLVLILILELISDYSPWLSLVLIVVSLLLFFGKSHYRLQSAIVSGLLFAKLVLLDSWHLRLFDTYGLFSNSRLIVFLAAIALYYFLAHVWKTERDVFILSKFYLYAGTFLAFLLLVIELEEFWISIGWTILALAVMIWGLAANNKDLRLQAMIIFGISILKVFLYDTRNVETIFRTVSYIVLGAILLLVSFLYTKYKDKLKEIL